MKPLSTRDKAIVQCLWLYLLPLIGAIAPMVAAGVYVHRSDAICWLTHIPRAHPVISANTLATSYYLAVASVLVFGSSSALLLFSGRSFFRLYRRGLPPGFNCIIVGGVMFSIFVASLCFLLDGAIDDNLVRILFALTYKVAEGHHITIACNLHDNPLDVALPGFILASDAHYLGFATFVAYLLSALVVSLTTATQALTRPKIPAHARMTTLNTALFLAAAVFITAAITSKCRFDLGMTTLASQDPNAKPTAAFLEYQTIANAVLAYMAAIQSLFLGLLYVPSALIVSPRSIIMEFNKENFARAARLLAIASPPIVNKFLEVFTKVPTPSG